MVRRIRRDVPTENVSILRHGHVPKAPNDATYYLDGSPAWSIPFGQATPTSLGLAIWTANFILDGGGSVLGTGIWGDVGPWDYDIVLAAHHLLADQSGSAVLDFWVDTYANFPPTVADTITASAKPTISSAVKATDSTLTGWSKTITAGKILRVNVDSCSGIKRLGVALKYTR